MTSLLFSPLRIAGLESRNRVMVSPMCMYAAEDGMANEYHLVHLGRFALGGAGIVVAEATAVEERGRISYSDLGLWRDDQGEALAPVAAFLKRYGAVPGIQLGHAGRKAATQAPWDGAGPLTAADAHRGEAPWPVVGPLAESAGPGWPTPVEMSTAEIVETVDAWRAAAERAHRAGFEVIDLHGAHGYLLHSFLSPVSNRRTDEWGGSAEARMRYPLAVVRAIREVLPSQKALFYRLSSVDGIEGGLTIQDTIEFARRLHEAGVDVIDTSSGGVVADRRTDTRVRRGYAFHAPYSRDVKAHTDLLVATVGLIVDAAQAEAVLTHGDADIVAIGRELLVDPSWALHARAVLEPDAGFQDWHPEAGWWLEKRVSAIRHLQDAGETPLTRYR